MPKSAASPPNLPPGRAKTGADIWASAVSWLDNNLKTAIIFGALSAALPFAITLLLPVFYVFYPLDHIPTLDEFAEQGLTWTLASTVVCALLSYWRTAGTRRFFGAVIRFPGSLLSLFGAGGNAARVHILWGLAVSFLVSTVVSPALSAVVAVIFAATVPSIFGRILSNFLFRIWSALISWISPEKRQPLAGAIMMAIGLLGSVIALLGGFFIAATEPKVVIAVVCMFLAFALGAAKSKPEIRSIIIIAVIAGFVLMQGFLGPALAGGDDQYQPPPGQKDASQAPARQNVWQGAMQFANPEDAAKRTLIPSSSFSFNVDAQGRIYGTLRLLTEWKGEEFVGILSGQLTATTIDVETVVYPNQFLHTDEETREILKVPVKLHADFAARNPGDRIEVSGNGSFMVRTWECVLDPNVADARNCPQTPVPLRWNATGLAFGAGVGAPGPSIGWPPDLDKLRELFGDLDPRVLMLLALLFLGGSFGAFLGGLLGNLPAGEPWWKIGDLSSLDLAPPELPWLTLTNAQLNLDASDAAAMFRLPDGSLDIEALTNYFNGIYNLPAGNVRPPWMDEETFNNVLQLRDLALNKAQEINFHDQNRVDIPDELFADLPQLPPGHIVYDQAQLDRLWNMMKDGVADPDHYARLQRLHDESAQTGSINPDDVTVLEMEHQYLADKQDHEFDQEDVRMAQARQDDLARMQQEAFDDRLKAREEEARYEQSLADLESIRNVSARTGQTKINDFAYELDKLYRQDGTPNYDRIAQIKAALRNHFGREVAAPDEALQATSLGDVIYEGTADTIDDTLDKHNSKSPWLSLFVRAGSAYLSGGWSELAFQGYSGSKKLSQAVGDASDYGQDFNGWDTAYVLAKHGVEENLPVNTLMTLNRLRTQQMAGQKTDVTAGEIGFSVLADTLSVINLRGMQGVKHSPVRRFVTESTKDARSVGEAGQMLLNASYKGATRSIDHAMTGLGLKAPLPATRLSPKDARLRFDANELTPETRRLIEEAKNARTEADQAFALGRLAGQRKVHNLIDAMDEIKARKLTGKPISEAEQARLQENLRRAVIEVQADKHAMNRMNRLPKNADGTNAAIREFNGQMQRIYDTADAAMIKRLADEYGVRPEDIKPVTITNMKGAAKGPIDPNAPLNDHVGHASRWTKEGTVKDPHVEPKARGEIPDEVRVKAKEYTDAHRRNTIDESMKPKPKLPDGKKVSMDRDLTMRVRTVDEVTGKVVWKDIPSSTTGRIYNEEIYKAATGEHLPPRTEADLKGKSTDFKDVHLKADEILDSPFSIKDPDKFAKRLDQATTDRLHPEAYGRGQGDLDTATKDAFRGRDLSDAAGTARTMEFKEHHWLKEADELRRAASETGDPLRRQNLLAQATAHQEEGQRQLVKQFKNMVITRTEAMSAIGNAPGASIPHSLSERINVLQSVQDGHITPSQAEGILKRMGTSTEQTAAQMSAYVEGLQTLRGQRGAPPGVAGTGGDALSAAQVGAFGTADLVGTENQKRGAQDQGFGRMAGPEDVHYAKRPSATPGDTQQGHGFGTMADPEDVHYVKRRSSVTQGQAFGTMAGPGGNPYAKMPPAKTRILPRILIWGSQ
jgi:hypothetical protein